MAQTFDIRFARSSGLAALFDAAGNSFGWKGRGRISIDPHGMNVAPTRTLAWLLAGGGTRRIPAENIKEVYREGDSLRVEFSTGDNPRATLPFWVSDADTAARIVQLLPTTRTVEIEHGPDDTRRRTVSRGVPLVWIAALVLIAASTTLFVRSRRPEPVVAVEPASVPDAHALADARSLADAPLADSASANTSAPSGAAPIQTSLVTPGAAPAPAATATSVSKSVADPIRYITADEARKLAMLAEDPIDWTQPPPSSRRSATEAAARAARMRRLEFEGEPAAEEFVPMEIPEIRIPAEVVPIKQTSLAYDTARDLLRYFEAAAHKLDERYRDERDHFDDGSMDARTFANRLDALEIRWRSLGEGMLSDRRYADPALTGLRVTLVYVAMQQRVFLMGYGAGLREGNQEKIDRAFQELARGVDAMARARAYVN